jgi:hypothetical protein
VAGRSSGGGSGSPRWSGRLRRPPSCSQWDPAVRLPLARKSPPRRRWTSCTTSAGSPPTMTPGCRSAWSSRRSSQCGACPPPGSSAKPGGRALAPLHRSSGRPAAPRLLRNRLGPPLALGRPAIRRGDQSSVLLYFAALPPALAVALVLDRGALSRPGETWWWRPTRRTAAWEAGSLAGLTAAGALISSTPASVALVAAAVAGPSTREPPRPSRPARAR